MACAFHEYKFLFKNKINILFAMAEHLNNRKTLSWSWGLLLAINIRIVALPIGIAQCGIWIIIVGIVVRGIKILSDDIGPDPNLRIGIGTRCRIRAVIVRIRRRLIVIVVQTGECGAWCVVGIILCIVLSRCQLQII